MKVNPFCFIIPFIIWGVVYGQHPRCEEGSCYPATGDLLIGREKKLHTDSTCGLKVHEQYCIVSHLKDVKKCFYCDSKEPYNPRRRQPLNHRIENIVYSFGRRKRGRWWQAENGKENVYIQLDLEAEFHFTHLIMRFKTFRPAGMLVERSYDFGKTWKVYRYFAENCPQTFPGVKTGPVKKLDDVICESRYSDVAPSTGGEVIFQVLPTSISIGNPYSSEVQDLLKLTNLRINFTKLHTLGDVLLHDQGDTKKKYYYAMYDMTVRGSCSCYGHASRCTPLHPEITGTIPRDMVHGKCECAHRTTGFNCDKCQDFYNDLPWRPARERQPNACKKCNCNNHATKCHFDPAVYEQTGRVSGGVCDDCQHNTMGRNCQFCKPFFYQDPNRRITDPDVCQHCNCDPSGSLRQGECHSHTSKDGRYIAGTCDCKRYVNGRRCDTCQNGYWNLKSDNPHGCEACICNVLGTSPGNSCSKITGDCICKRYVTGKQCDQCYPGYWGLSSDINGCKPCDCDIGGSLGETCDQSNGQCQCRPHIYGRKCDRPMPLYFIPGLDSFLFEAEFGRGLKNARVDIHERGPDEVVTWTGPGFMKVMEGDSIDFTITNLTASMEYDIVIRYNPLMPDRWEDVRVLIDRPGPVDPQGPCANSIPQDGYKATSLPPGSYYTVVKPPSCLEKNVTYIIKLVFNRYKSDRATPQASVLIDSIVLIPNTDSIPIFQGPQLPQFLKNNYIRYRCAESQYPAVQSTVIDICKRLFFSISSVLHLQAVNCDCDPTGSESSECDVYGGHCICKENVIGRRCEQCAPGTYNFGPTGCSPCNCDAAGSRDNFCEPDYGRCLCIPNVEGRACDRCEEGYWGFPRCRKCECNNMADTCDNLSGHCIGCRDFTSGPYCDRCTTGYYQDPRVTGRIACQPCFCPDGPGKDNQRADTCSFDLQKRTAICHCQLGYAGNNCDRCAENYFGDPVAGTCKQCDCNGNIDYLVPGSCDTNTGECIKCRYNTDGFNCEHCKPGYYGDATQQNCKECVCHHLGTDMSSGSCDRVTGQCHCHANVIGTECDRCAPGFWNLASGEGCEPCNCDPNGSFSSECNQFDGQCQCKTGRGGRTCGDCEDYYWGDPSVQCHPCNCTRVGSLSTQCDRRTGQCTCVPGVAGHNCDRCARGTTGTLPNCKPCGECFANWDKEVQDLSVHTRDIVNKVTNITVTGAAGAFEKEFNIMKENIDEVRQIIEAVGGSSENVKQLSDMLENIKRNLTTNSRLVTNTEKNLENTSSDVLTYRNKLAALQLRIGELREEAERLNKSAQSIKERDFEGAYNITQEAKEKSEMAKNLVTGAEKMLKISKNVRTELDDLISNRKDSFDKGLEENEKNLNGLDKKVAKLDDKLMDINEMVCGKKGDPCDTLCGGGGCDKCGGFGCENGAVTKANKALELANEAKKKLAQREDKVKNILDKLGEAKEETQNAKNEVQSVYNKTLKAKNESEHARADLEKLLKDIGSFLSNDKAKPENIRKLAEETLAISISLTPEQIRDLAAQINSTVKGLTDIEKILNETNDDLNRARRLKERADKASLEAGDVLDTADHVQKALEGAKMSQDKAAIAIDQVQEDIKNAKEDLQMIENIMSTSATNATKSLKIIKVLKDRLNSLEQKRYISQDKLSTAMKLTDQAMKTAIEAEKIAQDLEAKYNSTSGTLRNKYNATAASKERAILLKKRANELAVNTTKWNRELKRVVENFKKHSTTVDRLTLDIEGLQDKMKIYLDVIKRKAKYYAECLPQQTENGTTIGA